MVLVIRSVSYDWEHPTDPQGEYVPLWDESYSYALSRWLKAKQNWTNGLILNPDYVFDPSRIDKDSEWIPMPDGYAILNSFEDTYGDKPDSSNFRPDWTHGFCTCAQIYDAEKCIPVSPVFTDPSLMAAWAIDSLELVDLESFRLPDSDENSWLLEGIKVRWRGRVSHRAPKIITDRN